MEQYDEKGMVICQECGKPLNLIIKQHLQFHNMSFQEYKNKYPDFPTCSKAFSARQKLRNVKLFDNSIPIIETKELTNENEELTLKFEPEEIKIEDFGDIDIDKIPIVSKDYIEKVSNFIEEVKTFTNEQTIPNNYPDPNNIIPKDKIKFLNLLLLYFGNNVKNSYFIEKKNIQGSLEERLVSDISIPNMKINIEFPNTFWHNFDIPKVTRDSKLKSMGWKVIDIFGIKPSIQNLKDTLKKFNLI